MADPRLALLLGTSTMVVLAVLVYLMHKGVTIRVRTDLLGRRRQRKARPAEPPREPERETAAAAPYAPQQRPSGGGVLAPSRAQAPVAEPAVRRLVVDAPVGGQEREPRLPARVAVGSGWHGSFFHGWCGSSAGSLPSSQLTVRGLTMRGATHAGLDTEGQDAIGATWDETRSALYLAVADGVGSLPRSGPVALHAINAALHLCVNRPGDVEFADGGTRLFASIASGLVRSLGGDRDRLDGACTLVVAEIVPRFDGAGVTVHGVGDSEAWALYAEQWTPLHHERGAPDNATRALPAEITPQTHRFHLSPGSVLMLGSDGFAGALDDSGSGLGRGLAQLWRARPSWLDFINHVSFVDEYWSDDRSAIAVWIGEGAPDA